jgi:hypothetical protein
MMSILALFGVFPVAACGLTATDTLCSRCVKHDSCYITETEKYSGSAKPE